MYDDEMNVTVDNNVVDVVDTQAPQVKQEVIEEPKTQQEIYQESIPVVENGNDIF